MFFVFYDYSERSIIVFPKEKFLLPEFTSSFSPLYAIETTVCVRNTYRVRIYRTKREGGREGIDFSAGLCEMKPGRAIAINNDKNNPIRRLFDLSAPIYFAHALYSGWLRIFLDLGARSRMRARAIAVRSARSNLSNRARRTILAIVISITSHFPSLRRDFLCRRPRHDLD